MQQQAPAVSPFVSFPGPNLCMAAAPGHLVPAESFGSGEDGGKLLELLRVFLPDFQLLNHFISFSMDNKTLDRCVK